MAKGENDGTSIPFFWHDPLFFYQGTFSFFPYSHWDFLCLTKATISEVSWISKMAEERFEDDDDDDLLDIFLVLRVQKQAWNRIYENFENAFLEKYMLKIAVMRDTKHCCLLNWPSYQLSIMQRRKAKMKVFKRLLVQRHDPQSDHIDRCFLPQGRQACVDESDILQGTPAVTLSIPNICKADTESFLIAEDATCRTESGKERGVCFALDTPCSQTPEMYYSLTEKYVTPLRFVDGSSEESNELLNTTQSIEADQNTEFVYDKQCETEIRKLTENSIIRNEVHTLNEQTRNFPIDIEELEKSKNISNVVDACNNLSSARKCSVEIFCDLKQRKLRFNLDQQDNNMVKETDKLTAKLVNDVDFDKLSPEKENTGRRRKKVDGTFSEEVFDQILLLRDVKEDADKLTAKFVNDFDFDKLSPEKENPGRRRKTVDSTFSEELFDQIPLLRDVKEEADKFTAKRVNVVDFDKLSPEKENPGRRRKEVDCTFSEEVFDQIPLQRDVNEEADKLTAKHVNVFDFDKFSPEKENPGRRRKKVDCTFSEEEFDRILLLRDLTWLPLNQLPVPKVELTVGFVPDFPPLMAIIDLIAIGKPPAPHVSMRYELLRFCTLRSYPREDKPFLIKLAEAGFYYASDGDGVVCYSCGIRRYNWTADDYPMKIHKRINPTCKFLTKNEEVNVRNDFNGPFSKNLLYLDSIPEPGENQEPSEDINNDWAPERTRSPAPRPQSSQNSQSSSQLGINTAIPKHSQYATKPARIASFNGWPDSASHSPDELADAGFFYAGFGDCVRCFYCGIGLRHWTQDDNPWIEHARWAKNCVFVKQKKGDEFVNLVQLAVQYSQDNASQENTAANQLSPREIENYLLSDASQSVLAMGYQPRIIKKAIENILRQNRQTEITAQFLMEQVLALEEAGNSTQAAPASGSPAAPVAHVDPTEGALASAPKQSASIKSNDKESGNATHKPVANEKKKEEKKTSKKTNAEAKETRSNDALAQDPKAIKAENEQLKEQTLCKICLDQTVSIVFLPCGHLVTCADCAPAMRKCPICRALVQGTVRTYMS